MGLTGSILLESGVKRLGELGLGEKRSRSCEEEKKGRSEVSV